MAGTATGAPTTPAGRSRDSGGLAGELAQPASITRIEAASGSRGKATFVITDLFPLARGARGLTAGIGGDGGGVGLCRLKVRIASRKRGA